MRRQLAVLVAALVVTGFVGGFAGTVAGSSTADATTEECEFPVTVTDATGEEITLEEPPERITTTNPSAAQILWEFGAQDRVVGVTQFAHYLDGAEEKTNVSAEFGVDTERVVGTEPDLVLAPNASAGDVESLREAGLTVYHFPSATSVDDIADKTERTGLLTGHCEEAAETNEWMYDHVEEVRAETADLDRPDVLYPLGDGFVAAGNTFIDEILTVGGVHNVAAEDHEGYPQLSDEVILEMNPEYLLVTDENRFTLDEEPYASTTAGQEGNTIQVQVHYLNQPAPRSVVESTTAVYQQVHGAAEETPEATPEDTPTETEVDQPADTEEPADTDETTPGFGVAAAVLAALATALLARRY